MDRGRFRDHHLQARRAAAPAIRSRRTWEVEMSIESPGHVHRWRAFAVLAVSFFMTIVDLTIVNVAWPTIGRDLHFSESSLQWVVTAYGLTFGGFLLLGGQGRRPARAATTPHGRSGGLHSRVAGRRLATSDAVLIIMRGLQGLGAAIVLPAALSIVMNMFAEGAERNRALGLWGAIGAAGATRRSRPSSPRGRSASSACPTSFPAEAAGGRALAARRTPQLSTASS
jgi:hypothetical protein